jgi:hypothetical protein
MAEPSRGLQISRRGWLLAGLLAPLFPARAADIPIVTFDGDNLHISSLGLHFLQGKSLSNIRIGSTVEYVATVQLFREQFASPIKRVEDHFFVSYDVWGVGEAYAVSTLGPPARRVANLSLSDTETWCMERVSVATAGIPKDQEIWLQLELRTVPPKLKSLFDGKGIHLDLIEALTPGQDERQKFQRRLRLADLDRSKGGRRG